MPLRVLAAAFAAGLLAVVLTDAFLTVVAPRRARESFRIARLYFAVTWRPYAFVALRIHNARKREDYLSVYGPLSLLLLLGAWAASLVLAFALAQWAIGLALPTGPGGVNSLPGRVGFIVDLYFSATTFFTLGSSDPANTASRVLMVVEVALGYSFLGLMVGYPPVLYGLFSRREERISMLDARAGSPPSATQLIIRQGDNPDRLEAQLAQWEEWAASILQSHLSYPMLAYFRSQHTNESWLGTLTTVIDASTLIICGSGEGSDLGRQARLTFAMARHALVDLATVFGTRPKHSGPNRISDDELLRIRKLIAGRPIAISTERFVLERIAELRATYEPYAQSLASYFLIALPPWCPAERRRDNWESTSWDRAVPFAVSDPFLDSP